MRRVRAVGVPDEEPARGDAAMPTLRRAGLRERGDSNGERDADRHEQLWYAYRAPRRKRSVPDMRDDGRAWAAALVQPGCGDGGLTR